MLIDPVDHYISVIIYSNQLRLLMKALLLLILIAYESVSVFDVISRKAT